MTTNSYTQCDLRDAKFLSAEDSFHDPAWVIYKLPDLVLSRSTLDDLYSYWYKQWNFVTNDALTRKAYKSVQNKIKEKTLSEMDVGFYYCPYVPTNIKWPSSLIQIEQDKKSNTMLPLSFIP